MKYELAKQLKGAGFPQNPNGKGYSCFEPVGEVCGLPESEHETKCDDWDCKRCEVPDVYPPLLEELIEACGDRFTALERAVLDYKEIWRVYFPRPHKGFISHYTGKTPEEAVAKLWLALNK